jgi:hypothetical protein
MRKMSLVQVGLPALVLMAGVFVSAQASGQDWQKSYPVPGKASLRLSTGDASVEIRSCGECRAIRVEVDWKDRKATDYNINEFQSGDHVNFELKEKAPLEVHIFMGHRREPHVTVESPAALDLDGQTTDGGLTVSGLQGRVELHTSDGAVDVSDVSGSLRLTASDGSIRIHNVSGTLESHSSDGHASIEGKFTAVQVRTSDGSLDMTFADGTQLSAASRIESSDGQVAVRIPRTLAADLDVHTGDGQIHCSLPVTMQGYTSSHSSGHDLRGHLNAGGVPLTIHTSDGNVTISAL